MRFMKDNEYMNFEKRLDLLKEELKNLSKRQDFFSTCLEKINEKLIGSNQSCDCQDKDPHKEWIDDSIEKILVEIESEDMCKANAIQCFCHAIYSICGSLDFAPVNFDTLTRVMRNDYLKVYRELNEDA